MGSAAGSPCPSIASLKGTASALGPLLALCSQYVTGALGFSAPQIFQLLGTREFGYSNKQIH